jgi:hypothetical protein
MFLDPFASRRAVFKEFRTVQRAFRTSVMVVREDVPAPGRFPGTVP